VACEEARATFAIIRTVTGEQSRPIPRQAPRRPSRSPAPFPHPLLILTASKAYIDLPVHLSIPLQHLSLEESVPYWVGANLSETRNLHTKTLLLLKPRGFCAGVVRAIDIVRIALEAFGRPIYVRKEIVHNRFVVEELQQKGAIFVDNIDEVPEGERVIYSAHGVSPEVREASKLRSLRVIDATCPLVTKVHVEAVKFAKEGYSLILIGHRDHDEVIGTLGEAPAVTQVVGSPAEVASVTLPDPNRVAYLTQTTLSLDETRDIIAALRQRFPNIKGPAAQDICYATENRQVAVKHVAADADLLLVVGSDNSSNSKRLVEVARSLGTEAHLIDDCRNIQAQWLDGVKTVALTAGASAPEHLVQEVVEYLAGNGFGDVQELEIMPENVRFGLPPEIVATIASAPAAAAMES
jgi:4-hydroxy-3-methylbut-2-en-1-yl diphosphate reductase